MNQSPHTIRLLAAALLSASLLTVGAGAVELDGNSVSAIHVDQNSAPVSAATAVAKNDSPVTLKDAAGQYQVTYQSKSGAETAATVTATKSNVDAYVCVNVDTVLNVRQGPGTSYEILCTVEDGTLFPLTGKTGSWYQVLCNGRTGYISTTYATIENSEAVFPGQSSPSKPAAPTISSASPLAEQIVLFAKQYVGYPYVYGTAGPNTFDCSGFTSYVYAQFGYSLHRSSKDQVKDGVPVSKDSLQPADLLLFSNNGSGGAIGHVGLYIGNGKFIHASTPSSGVIISDLSTDWYIQHYICAQRVL